MIVVRDEIRDVSHVILSAEENAAGEVSKAELSRVPWNYMDTLAAELAETVFNAVHTSAPALYERKP